MQAADIHNSHVEAAANMDHGEDTHTLPEKAMARARAKFVELDADGSGTLSGLEVLKLIDWVWSSFHPGGQPLAAKQKA